MIAPDMLCEVAGKVQAVGSAEQGLAALRAEWPGLRFVACSDDDIPPRCRPAFEGEGFNLYLVGGGEHCLALTQDAELAIGVVVASVSAED
ncbi:MAG: DUF6129 family protein [Rhodocyclaceae bacterium]|jgi:hypothetical protein|nr:DUF6129 family protein [Rhodocyclaceae bacterium]